MRMLRSIGRSLNVSMAIRSSPMTGEEHYEVDVRIGQEGVLSSMPTTQPDCWKSSD
jgi:hypothetical protein